MSYFLDFRVAYGADMSQKDLFTIWAKEADAALGARSDHVLSETRGVDDKTCESDRFQ